MLELTVEIVGAFMGKCKHNHAAGLEQQEYN
jgi:hypothetical protein